MNKSFIYFLFLLLPLSFRAQGQSSDQGELEYYRSLNDKEQRLIEFRDNDEALKLKIAQLGIINKSRKKHGAEPVKLDILASRVANRMAREAAENGYVSHWNMAGEKPYHRYAFAGGLDHVSENAYGEWSSEEYDKSDDLIGRLMKTGHEIFMKEKAPNDGHKKNIIEKGHNFVGLGFYIAGGQFRYYEEFIDRYIEFVSVPSSMEVNEAGTIVVDTKGSGYLYYIMVYRENFPKPRKVPELKKTGSYQDYTNEIYQQIPAWDLAKYRKGSVYTIPVKFKKEGLYYIQLFTDKKENTGQSAVSTKGKTPVSGIVITVKN